MVNDPTGKSANSNVGTIWYPTNGASVFSSLITYIILSVNILKGAGYDCSLDLYQSFGS